MAEVSVVVPLYNEERRSSQFLHDLMAFANSKLRGCEIIFVNDGSTDRTLEIINEIAKRNKNAKVVSYTPNRGKGFAVKQGMLAATGSKAIFIDADGSISPEEIPAMLRSLDSYDAVAGTRASSQSEVRQPFLRKFVGISFNLYVNVLYGIGVRDTLCGFKGFRKEAVQALFPKLISERWIFDVELFYRIRKHKLSLFQQPIKWEHRKGSRFKLLDPLKMAVQLLKLRIILLLER